MSLLTRVIPVLRTKGNALVAPLFGEGLRILGKPEDFAAYYYREQCDELVLLDVVSSLYQRSPLLDVVSRVADQVFIPLAAGGGVRSVDDAQRLLRAGADKVSVNTAAVRRPHLLREMAEVIGCQSVVLYVEARRKGSGWECMTDGTKESSGREVLDWVQEAVALGAGEVLLFSVDNDGRQQGYDLGLIRQVSEAVNVPVIAWGGAGNPNHCIQALRAGADAVAAASIFHYDVAAELNAGEQIQGRRGSEPRWQGGLRQVKETLAKGGVAVR